MDITIRQARKQDVPSVLQLYAEEEIDDGDILSIHDAEKIFDIMHSYPDYKVYLAEYNGRPVGTFALAIMHNLAHRGKSSGLVEDVVVAGDMRSKGIGGKMMGYAIEKCREHHCYKMRLSSSLKRESAHRFYERLGFTKHGYSFFIEL
jgi:GNAT superfamily N-acetyltransferase